MMMQDFDQMRRAMVASQLRTTGVSDPAVVAAMGSVPRERYLDPGRAPLAYADMIVPLGEGRALNTPMALGRMLSEARPRPGERALVVGAATGYAAAVLAEAGLSVVAVEAAESLVEQARAALAGSAVEIVHARLTEGHAAGAPYDLVLIDGAVEAVPDTLIAQLAEGGRLVTGIMENGVTRLEIGRKVADAFGSAGFADVAMPVVPGFAQPEAFTF